MGKGHSDSNDEELDSTDTYRHARFKGLHGSKRKSKSYTKARASSKLRYYEVAKAHHRKVTRKEETGKEILARIMREINANIRRKERAQEIRKK